LKAKVDFNATSSARLTLFDQLMSFFSYSDDTFRRFVIPFLGRRDGTYQRHGVRSGMVAWSLHDAASSPLDLHISHAQPSAALLRGGAAGSRLAALLHQARDHLGMSMSCSWSTFFTTLLTPRGSRSTASLSCTPWSPRLSLRGRNVSSRAYLRLRKRTLQLQELVFSNALWPHNHQQPHCPRVLPSPSRLQSLQ
jgi:hypothetical protein